MYISLHVESVGLSNCRTIELSDHRYLPGYLKCKFLWIFSFGVFRPTREFFTHMEFLFMEQRGETSRRETQIVLVWLKRDSSLSI